MIILKDQMNAPPAPVVLLCFLYVFNFYFTYYLLYILVCTCLRFTIKRKKHYGPSSSTSDLRESEILHPSKSMKMKRSAPVPAASRGTPMPTPGKYIVLFTTVVLWQVLEQFL